MNITVTKKEAPRILTQEERDAFDVLFDTHLDEHERHGDSVPKNTETKLQRLTRERKEKLNVR